ncbi:MAG TPA: hypothetical protein VNG33_07645, partial [Polyangiaceae bacterium]|nr:hypothetical protein [Polyangiaceae bacterium]
MKGQLAVVLALALGLGFSGSAYAQALRFVLVSGSDPELGRRLVAEGKQAGFELVAAQGDEQAAPSELAKRNHAVGVLRASGSAAVELWLIGNDRQPPGSASFRQQSDDAQGFAVRVIEETRSRVVALHLPALVAATPLEPPAERDATVDVPAPEPRKRGPLDALDVGAGLGLTRAAGLGPTLHAALHAGLRLVPRLGVGAFGFIPLAANDFTGAEGTGHARVYLFGAGLEWVAWQPAAAWRAALGAGAGALWLPLRAEPNAGYSSRSDHLACGVAFASASLAVRLTDRLGLRAGM